MWCTERRNVWGILEINILVTNFVTSTRAGPGPHGPLDRRRSNYMDHPPGGFARELPTLCCTCTHRESLQRMLQNRGVQILMDCLSKTFFIINLPPERVTVPSNGRRDLYVSQLFFDAVPFITSTVIVSHSSWWRKWRVRVSRLFICIGFHQIYHSFIIIKGEKRDRLNANSPK